MEIIAGLLCIAAVVGLIVYAIARLLLLFFRSLGSKNVPSPPSDAGLTSSEYADVPAMGRQLRRFLEQGKLSLDEEQRIRALVTQRIDELRAQILGAPVRFPSENASL